jgi:cobalamin biosynthesis Co2+ chelatase CbiK
MSGIYEMDKDNVLIIITGFDQKRVEQLLNYFEPRKVSLFLQTGDQYQNNILNAKQYKESFESFLHIEILPINAYSEDYGQADLEKLVVKERENSNIVIASLGPKPSAIAVYRLNKKYPDIGLIYVPVARYNETYSSGLSKNNPIFEQIK